LNFNYLENQVTIILPINIAETTKDLLDELVRYRAFVSRPSYDRDGAVIRIVSKMLRNTTGYPAGGVPESWVVHVDPRWSRKNIYAVTSVFYGDIRLANALTMNDIPFDLDTYRVVTGDESYLAANPTHRAAPFNITVVHGQISLNVRAQSKLKDSQHKIHNSLAREWEVIQDVYEPRSLSELDLKQAEFAHRFIAKVQQMGNPTFGLGELYIVDTGTFKRRLRTIQGFGGEVQKLAYETLVEFESVEHEFKVAQSSL